MTNASQNDLYQKETQVWRWKKSYSNSLDGGGRVQVYDSICLWKTCAIGSNKDIQFKTPRNIVH